VYSTDIVYRHPPPHSTDLLSYTLRPLPAFQQRVSGCADPFDPFLSILPATTRHDQPSLTFDLEFSFLPEDSRLTCAPDPPNDVDGYKNRIPDPVLVAAGGCTPTTAKTTAAAGPE